MKKLKVVLTLLLVLCCSVGLFACKPDETAGGTKNIAEVKLSGQKENFNEGEDFSTGSLKVTVYYQGDDNEHELTADEYEVDSSAYNKDKAGKYLIYVIPKNQPAELTAGGKDNRVKRSYYATVDHSWKEATSGAYQYECACGAKRNSYHDLEDKVETVAWGNQAKFIPGGENKNYPLAKAPIAGENHVSYGSLVAGQSLTLTLKITNVTKSEDPTKADNWDSPLMGIRNGAEGILPREDGWIIGSAAGYQVPAESNIPVGGGAPAAGIATAEDELWQVKQDGTTWFAGSAFVDAETKTKWSTVVVEYDYQTDGVMHMRHTLQKFDGTVTKLEISVNLPKAAYEVVVYGEFCNFTVTDVEFVAGLAITDYKVDSQPTNLEQPEGKLFDTTGLKATATFSDGSKLTENNYNVYAYRNITPEATEAVPEPEPVKTRVTLATEPLTRDMYGFFIEFNGESQELSDQIKVIPTIVTGANATEIAESNASFEAPEVGYDYAVTADKQYIRLTMTGTAAKATAAQTAALGDGYTHFIAFKLLTNLADDAFDDVTVGDTTNAVVKLKKVGTTVDVVVGLKTGYQAFDLTFKKGDAAIENGKVQIDLSGLNALPTAGAEITETKFTLDAGGTYTVKYTGLTGTLTDLTLATGNARNTVAEVKAAIKAEYTEGTVPTRTDYYRASNTLFVVKVDDNTAGELTVTYWLAAPDLGNLTSERMATTVSVCQGSDVLTSANLVYSLEASSTAINIGTEEAPVYVTVNGNKLLVYALVKTTDIKDGLNFAATLNVEHTYVEGQPYKMDYNVGLTVKNGEAAWLDENDLTSGDSVAKLIALGTANNTNDYDKGAILVASLHLPNLEVRKDDNEAVFHFTANENTLQGQDEYTIYTVTGNKIEGTEKLASAAGNREEVQEGNCVTDGVEAYKEGNFFYGALIVPASGAHTWEPKTGAANTDECSVCHYTRERVTVSETEFQYVVLGTPTSYADTGEVAWWAGSHGRVNNLSGDFALEYTYTHADGTGDYTNARLQLFSADVGTFDNGTTPNITIDLTNADDVTVNTALTVGNEDAVITKEFTIDGVASTEYLTHGGSHGESNGEVVARITRVGNVLTVTSTWKSVTNKVYFCKRVISNVAAIPMSVHINGWTAAVQNLTSKKGNVETWTNGEVKIGETTYKYEVFGQTVTNLDATGEWWNGTTTDFAVPEGDFAVVWTFSNSRDKNWYQDAVIELNTIGETSLYFDSNFLIPDGSWGALIAKDGVTTDNGKKDSFSSSMTFNGTAISDPPKQPAENDDYGGDYTVVIIRDGSTLIVYETLVVGENTWTCTITDTAFTTEALRARLTGNPYWLDNITVALGTFTKA